MNRVHQRELVLALYPTSNSFSFILFEGPQSPYDWGVKKVVGPKKNAKVIREVERIIDRYHPGILIIEDTDSDPPRRSTRIRRLYRLLSYHAIALHMEVHRITRQDVQEYFREAGATTKQEIARIIAAQIPAFVHRIPKVRKAWMSDNGQMSLFDAAALGTVYFAAHAPRSSVAA